MRLLRYLCGFFLAVAVSGQTIAVSVSNIPAAATRLIAVLDGGSIAGGLRVTQNITAGTTNSVMSIGAGAGGPYRVRVVAVKAVGSVMPVLRSGKVTGLSTTAGSVGTAISLSDVSASLDSSSPPYGIAGGSATLTINITDAGDFLEGATGTLYTASAPFAENLAGATTFSAGTATLRAAGVYSFAATVTWPSQTGTFYYQLGAISSVFTNGTSGPGLVWPNLDAGQNLQTMSVTAGYNISVSVLNIPASATRVLAAVDGGSIPQAMRVARDFSAGTPAMGINVAVPAGGPYRIRVMAYKAGDVISPVLRTGKATGLTSTSAVANITLDDPTVTLDARTPASGATGAAVSVGVNVTDPGDFLEGATADLYASTAPFTTNLAAPLVAHGVASATSTGYAYSFPANLPGTAGQLYYQMAATSPTLLSGTDLPVFIWPNLEAGASLKSILVTAGKNIAVVVNNIPVKATRLLAVVDSGSLAGAVRVWKDIAPGTSTTALNVGVPVSGVYRVRVVAYQFGDVVNPILRSGKTSGISVTSGNVSTTVNLGDFTGALDPSTPASGSAGTAVTIKINVNDPGDYLEGAAATLFTATLPFEVNLLTASSVAAGFPTGGNGIYQYSLTTNLPAAAGALYFQLAASSLGFQVSTDMPAFLWPNLETGAVLPSIVSGGTPVSPQLSVSALTFSTIAGQVPAAQPVTLSMPNNSAVAFSASATSAEGWLSVSPVAGTTPVTAQVTANPNSLLPGVHTGTVTFVAAGKTLAIPVTLNLAGSRILTDFRNIGRSDIVVYNPATGDSYIGLSDGAGGFSFVWNPWSPQFSAFRSGYFTPSGRAGLLLYNKVNALGYLGSGDGTGRFTFGSVFWSPGYDRVEPADLNGDGLTDLLIYRTFDGTMYSVLSNGDGTFRYKYMLVTVNYSDMVLADFNGDGRADVFLYRKSDGTAHLGLSDGSGGFAFSPVALTPGFDFVRAGDLNGDGQADLILYSSATGASRIGIRNGSGFTFTQNYWSPGFNLVQLFDFDGDGKSDLVLYNKVTTYGYLGLSDGTGNFRFSSLFWGSGMDTLAVMDLNGDGKTDILIYNTQNGAAYSGLSSGNPAAPFSYKYTYFGNARQVVQ